MNEKNKKNTFILLRRTRLKYDRYDKNLRTATELPGYTNKKEGNLAKSFVHASYVDSSGIGKQVARYNLTMQSSVTTGKEKKSS